MKRPFRRKKELKKQVTTETIEEHREEVLSKGRKFKYPFQYAKHKLVLNTIVIGIVAVLLSIGFGWLQLYRFQSTGDILYRFTKVIPVPVANVDGENVRYSDYLMIYRSSIMSIEKQKGVLTDSEEDKVMREQYKRKSLDRAVEFTYALKLAKELDVEVTQDQIREAEREHRVVDGVERDEEKFAKIIQTGFGLTVEEYERLWLLTLTKREVVVAIDEEARATAGEVEALLDGNGGDFSRVVGALGDKVVYEETGELVSMLNLDERRAAMASSLEVGEWSARFVPKNGDGYYFLKLLAKSDGQVKYVSLKVPFGEFDRRMKMIRKEGKVTEYIKVDRIGDDGEMIEAEGIEIEKDGAVGGG